LSPVNMPSAVGIHKGLSYDHNILSGILTATELGVNWIQHECDWLVTGFCRILATLH